MQRTKRKATRASSSGRAVTVIAVVAALGGLGGVAAVGSWLWPASDGNPSESGDVRVLEQAGDGNVNVQETEQAGSGNVMGNNNGVSSGNVSQSAESGGVNVNVGDGSDVVVNPKEVLPDLPYFDEGVDDFESASDLERFLTDNANGVVQMNSYLWGSWVRGDYPGDTTDARFSMYTECFEPLDPGESPSVFKCVGLSIFVPSTADIRGSAAVPYQSGAYRLVGFFEVGLNGTQQGINLLTLRPVAAVDAQQVGKSHEAD
ncbi:MAG: hypothetical protein AB7O92_04245 [Acidimicrobiia bacterium]